MDLFNNLGSEEPQDWALGCFAAEPKHMPRNAPRGFRFLPHDVPEAGSNSKKSSLRHTRQAGFPEQCQEAGCFDPAPSHARGEFSSGQRRIHRTTQQRSSVQLPAAADTSKGISTWL